MSEEPSYPGSLGEYQPSATDNRGHYERVTFRLPPMLHTQMEILLGSKKFPYRNEQDFVRHAVIRHCRYLLSHTQDVQNVMPQLEAITTMLAIEADRRQFGQVIELVEREIGNLRSEGDEPRAKELVRTTLAKIEQMTDPYWRTKWRNELTRRMGHLLPRQASLNPKTFAADGEPDGNY